VNQKCSGRLNRVRPVSRVPAPVPGRRRAVSETEGADSHPKRMAKMISTSSRMCPFWAEQVNLVALVLVAHGLLDGCPLVKGRGSIRSDFLSSPVCCYL